MQKTLKLNNGRMIPAIGLGTWRAKPGEVGAAVKYAVEDAGYRHIDCAAVYGNEKEIGATLHEALQSKKVKREELFITSKLWNTEHAADRVEKACRQTLADLQLDYLDLYLMHWGLAFAGPIPENARDDKGWLKLAPISIQETWQAMEKLVEKGLVKTIGVANFTVAQLIDLLTYAKIRPAMNQVELHPYNAQPDLLAYCEHEGIAVTAYSPLGSPGTVDPSQPRIMEDPVIKKIATAHNVTPSQVILSWGLQRNTAVIPKSTKPERLRENIDTYNLTLTAKEIDDINALNKNHRFIYQKDRWGIPYFA